jgi:hypothetical protein
MANVRSLVAQSDPDWSQDFVVDTAGRGIGASYEALAQADAHGKYIWVLDDDDVCVYPHLVRALRRLVDREDAVGGVEAWPELVMVKMDHGRLGVQPDEALWGRAPVEGHIGVSAFLVRRDVWLRHRQAFTPGHYASDFAFIAAAYAAAERVVWLDVVASRVLRISHGRSELEYAVVEPQERAVTR